MDEISREIHTSASMLGNINTKLLVVVTSVTVVAVVAVVVVAIVTVVVVVAPDVHGTVFMNVVALVEIDVVEVVAPAGSTAVLAMANNQDRKLAPIEWVEVPAHGHSSASGCRCVVAALGVRIMESGSVVVGGPYGQVAVVAVTNRTSDGEADREGEGDKDGGEAHDDCRDPGVVHGDPVLVVRLGWVIYTLPQMKKQISVSKPSALGVTKN